MWVTISKTSKARFRYNVLADAVNRDGISKNARAHVCKINIRAPSTAVDDISGNATEI